MARLIDADNLKKRFKEYAEFGESDEFDLWAINEAIDRQPTAIERCPCCGEDLTEEK